MLAAALCLLGLPALAAAQCTTLHSNTPIVLPQDLGMHTTGTPCKGMQWPEALRPCYVYTPLFHVVG